MTGALNPMFEVMIEDHFAAAHHLLNYNGQCENQHGHNFVVRVWAKAEQLDSHNCAIPQSTIRKALSVILDQLDHTDLNEFHGFNGQSTSSEFVSQYIYRNLKASLPSISRVCVFETPTSVAYYAE
jgi:6-pyruvoyltetrahydropterin/6-carboxytetrahydropterin synthase